MGCIYFETPSVYVCVCVCVCSNVQIGKKKAFKGWVKLIVVYIYIYIYNEQWKWLIGKRKRQKRNKSNYRKSVRRDKIKIKPSESL